MMIKERFKCPLEDMDDTVDKTQRLEKAPSLVRLIDECAKVTHTREKHKVITHMTAVISCNKM